MEKRFKVKRFLFETTNGEPVCRYMLTYRLLPILIPNQYIEMKSIRKLGTGRNYANKLCVFLNYLHEYCKTEYDGATNKNVLSFVDFLIYGDKKDFIIHNPQNSIAYSTLSGYVTAIADFYLWLDQSYGSQMVFYEGTRKCRSQSYLYGQIYSYPYKKLINRTLPDTKGRREYIKWYTEEERELLCSHFTTLRDEAVFRLTLEGFRIDEVLSMCLENYNSTEYLIQPTRSKGRQTAVKGLENNLRLVRISESTTETLNHYLYEERGNAENNSGIISDWLFINLRGPSIGKPLEYHNFLKILKKCAERAGVDKDIIRTHSGRSTKVMEVIEQNAENPENAKSDIQIKYLFGWRNIDSIDPYMNFNNEILAKSAFEKQQKGGKDND